jgi:hypothetical protein
MAWEDPIVAETRALRQVATLVKYLQERELDHPERLVSLPPRKPATAASAHEKKSGE